MTYRATLWAAIVLAATGVLGAAAQEPPPGPLPPPANREVKRIPLEPNPPPPSIPVEEIIRQFVEKENAAKQAFDHYAYRLTVRVQEFEEDGSPGGEIQVASDMVPPKGGARTGKIVSHPPSTLRRAAFALQDLRELAGIPLFVLTSDQLGKYELTYAGQQQVDELTTYVFQVKAKRVERGQTYFEGVIWVDDRDLVIVKTYGKTVTETPSSDRPLPFSVVETYRQPADGKYWFPAYMRSDDTLKIQAGEFPIRLTIRYTDFKPFAAASEKKPAEPAKHDAAKPPND